MRPCGSIFAIFVGPKRSEHPSFPDAFQSGIVLDWVDSARDLWRKMPAIMFHDVIVFDTRLQSEEQCRTCRALRQRGQAVLCLGCKASECAPCFQSEANLLLAITSSLGAPPAPTRFLDFPSRSRGWDRGNPSAH